MNVLEKMALGAGLVIVGATAVYRYVLNDEQREAIREVSSSIASATEEVSDSISPLVSGGMTHAEERARIEKNRARTRDQWEALGY
ncbi:MAG: hypothetical protein Q4A01_02735 [Coriobacteriales bacterium]|nr:hypothetical protein [Coriobacteriales bacterium]